MRQQKQILQMKWLTQAFSSKSLPSLESSKPLPNNKEPLDRPNLEYLLTLQEDPRYRILKTLLHRRLSLKQEKLSEKTLSDSQRIAAFNTLIGEIRELKMCLDLDQLVGELLTHSDE